MAFVMHAASLQWDLLVAYVEGIRIIFELPAPIREPDALDTALAQAEKEAQGKSGAAEVNVDVPERIITRYNALLDRLKTSAMAYHTVTPFPEFESQVLPLMIALRIIVVITALYLGANGAAWVFGLLSLQFVIGPLSFIPAITTLMALAQPHLIGHLAVLPILQHTLAAVLPTSVMEWTSFTISIPFIMAFMVIDQVLCAACVVSTPGNGASVAVTKSQLLRSVTYGFVNCKTYQLILFGLLVGRTVNVAVLVIDYSLSLSTSVSNWVASKGYTWSALFYHAHRIAHLPVVYQHAHKFHHFLHGTTAFDAHIYGSGMPEEFFMLLAEFLTCATLGVPPPCLNLYVVYLSWTNKVGHTRKQVSTNGNNAHANHHVFHVKNYGIYDMGLDMIMGTCADCDEHEMPRGFVARKSRVNNGNGAMVRLNYRKDAK